MTLFAGASARGSVRGGVEEIRSRMDVEGLFYLFVLLLGFYSAFLVRISTPACTVMRGVRLSPGGGGRWGGGAL